MKYVGHRLALGDCRVMRIDDGGRETPLDPRNDLYNHSPSGFEWGYSGSGPAQLALAILADYLSRDVGGEIYAICDARGSDVIRAIARVPFAAMKSFSLFDTLAVMLHQEFKARAIAPLERGDSFELTDEQVSEAIANLLEKEKPAP